MKKLNAISASPALTKVELLLQNPKMTKEKAIKLLGLEDSIKQSKTEKKSNYYMLGNRIEFIEDGVRYIGWDFTVPRCGVTKKQMLLNAKERVKQTGINQIVVKSNQGVFNGIVEAMLMPNFYSEGLRASFGAGDLFYKTMVELNPNLKIHSNKSKKYPF